MNARSTAFEFTCLGRRVTDITNAIFHSVIFNRCMGKFRSEPNHSYTVGTLGFEEIPCGDLDFTYIRVSSNDLHQSVNRDIRQFVTALRTAADAALFSTSPQSPLGGGFGGGGSQSPRSPPLRHHQFPVHLDLLDSHLRHNPLGEDPIHGSDDCYYEPGELGQLTAAQTAATGVINLEFHQKNPRATLLSGFAEPLVWEVWSLKFNWLREGATERLFNRAPLEEQLFDKLMAVVQVVNHSEYLPPMPNWSEVDVVFDTRFPDVQPYNYKISYKIGSGQTQVASEPRPGTSAAISTPMALKKIMSKLAL